MIREDATIGLDLSEGIDDVQTDTDIITVTGVKYTEDKQDYVYGTEGYMINLKENQLLAGNAEDGVNRIGQILVGFQILPFSLRSVPIGYATFGEQSSSKITVEMCTGPMQLTLNFCSRILPIFLAKQRAWNPRNQSTPMKTKS